MIPFEEKNILLIIAGPSGSGKTTVVSKMIETFSPKLERVITTTTRQPRENEQNGRDYHFLNEKEFHNRINNFLEWAKVFNNFYGTQKNDVISKLKNGIDLILNVDIQGVFSIKKFSETDEFLKSRIVTIFITPKNIESLRSRLFSRGQDSEENINLRLKTAELEVSQWTTFDYCIFSKTKEEDFDSAKNIYLAEKLKTRLC